MNFNRMSEFTRYPAWIPRQLVMPRSFPEGSREAERGSQPEGPSESEESSFYRPWVPPWRREVPVPRPGYETRNPPEIKRKSRALPSVPPSVPEAREEEADEIILEGRSGDREKEIKPRTGKPRRVQKPSIYGGEPRLRICPSNYTAMEIHGFFGLIDDGSASAGRMLIVHVPSWVKGYFLDLRDGENIHAAHVNGQVGGVLRVLAVGRHKYYSPGCKVSTCTVCVPEEQWERFKMD